MSVNLNPGLFAQNFQVKNNAVKQAPSVSLTTPLAGDTVSFKKAQNKVGFKAALPPINKAEEFAQALGKLLKDVSDNGQDYALGVVSRLKVQSIPQDTLKAVRDTIKDLPTTQVVRYTQNRLIRSEEARAIIT